MSWNAFERCFLPYKKQIVTFSQSTISFHRVVEEIRINSQLSNERKIHRVSVRIEFSSISHFFSSFRLFLLVENPSIKLVKSGSMLDKRSLFEWKKFNRRRARYSGRGRGHHVTEIGVTRRAERGGDHRQHHHYSHCHRCCCYYCLFVLGGNYVGRPRRR